MKLTPQGTSQNKTPQPLLDDIVAVRDDLLNERQSIPVQTIITGELSQAFTLLDPDLAMLHKDMKSAASQLETAIRKGHMVDMAQWRFESAQSAYQTRVMEIKNGKKGNAFATESIKGQTELDKAKRDMRNMAMQEAMNESFARRRKQKKEEKRRAEEKQGGWFFYMMLGLWLSQMNAQRRARSIEMSNLQNAFFNARTA